MPMLLRHALIRTRTVLTTPSGLTLVLFAAAGSFMLWPLLWLPAPNWPTAGRAFFWSFMVLTLWLWTWILTLPFSGGRGHWGTHSRVLPALPIGFRARLLAEAGAALGLILGFRALVVAAFVLGNPGALYDKGVLHGLLAFCSWILSSPLLTYGPAVVALPVVLAWLTPAGGDTTYYGRPFLVAVCTSLAPVVAPGYARETGVVAGLCLSPLVIAGSGASLSWRPRRKQQREAKELARPGIEPEARFRSDRWARLGPYLPLRLLLALLVLFSGPLLRVATDPPRGVLAFVVILGFVVGFALLAPLCIAPLGLNVLAGDIFSGQYSRAWAPLPVRPELVRRTVWAHGLASTTLVWLIFSAYIFAFVGFDWRPLSMGFAIPCVAGFLLCAAVGDRHRGILSAMTLVAFLPVYVTTLEAVDTTVDTTVHIGVLLALAVIGGVPPLVHLPQEGSRE